MNIELFPSILNGKIKSIPSKSEAHRFLISAALADKQCRVEIEEPFGDDILATINCLKALGANIERECQSLNITPLKAQKKQSTKKPVVLDCNESGSTARMLLPIASYINEHFIMQGKGRLPKRPMLPLIEALSSKGLSFSNIFLPLECEGSPLGGIYEIPGNISSQFISGLLFLLPLLAENSKVIITPKLESEGYVDMTLEALRKFKVEIKKTDYGYYVLGNQKYISPKNIIVNGDWSSAAFWLCSGALAGEITVSNLSSSSFQRDKKVVDILKQMGAKVLEKDNSFTVHSSSLNGVIIDSTDIPDLVPILSAVCCKAKGESKIINASRLRLKESDRIMSTCAYLRSLGANIKTIGDNIVIKGSGSLSGGIVDSMGDHRIAMAGAIASVICTDKVIVKNIEVVKKSYPQFFEDFIMLGGKAHVI